MTSTRRTQEKCSVAVCVVVFGGAHAACMGNADAVVAGKVRWFGGRREGDDDDDDDARSSAC